MASFESNSDEVKPDLSQVPKWFLLKLRDEMKAKIDIQAELDKMKFELEVYRNQGNPERPIPTQQILDEKEETIRQLKSKQYEMMIQLEQQRQTITAAINEIKQWKEVNNNNSSTKQPRDNDLLITKENELKQANERISQLESTLKSREDTISRLTAKTPGRLASNINTNSVNLSDPWNLNTEPLSMIDNNNTMTRNSTTAAAHVRRTTVDIGIDSIQQEIDQHGRVSSEFKPKVDHLQLEIADLMTRKYKLESLLREAERARTELPDIDKQLLLKRKDLIDVLKDMKSAKILRHKEKQKIEELDNRISIQKDPIKRRALLEKLPSVVCLPPASSHDERVQLRGPPPESTNNVTSSTTSSSSPSSQDLHTNNDESLLKGVPVTDPGYSYGKSVSLYPRDPITKQRQGDPIADRFCVSRFPNGTLLALADGCGWGKASQQAAITATDAFISYLKANLKDISKTRTGGRILLRAFQHAHANIVKDKNEEALYSTGTTTMLGGFLFQLANPDPLGEWVFVFASLGDCKAFRYNSQTNEVIDLTVGNRSNINDMRDPGGRIGPYMEGGPDLRNLDMNSVLCHEGDIILLVSDGVHDNLNPENNGLSPVELGLAALCEDNKWSSLKDKSMEATLKEEWMTHKILEFIEDSLKVAATAPRQNSASYSLAALVLQGLVDRLIDHSVRLTSNSRQFMETVADKQVPKDPVQYPGKMDHCTALAIMVGSSPNRLQLRKSS